MKSLKNIVITIFLTAIFTTVTAENALITIPAIQVKSDKPTKKQPVNGASFSSHTIKRQGSISMTDFFQQQGLVQIQPHSSLQTQNTLSMHGFSSNASTNTLLLIDGVPITSLTNISFDLNSILVDSLRNIIVLPGSYGVLYGDQAVGGVVNFITEIPNAAKTDITVGGGNEKQRLAQFNFSRHPNQYWGFRLSGLSYQTDNDQLHNFQNDYNVNMQLNYQTARDKITLLLFGYQNSIQIPNPKIWGQDNTSTTSDNHENIAGVTTILKNTFDINSRWHWQSALLHQYNRSHAFIHIDSRSQQQSILWHNEFNDPHHFNSGFDLQTEHYTLNNALQDNDVTSNIADVFAQSNIALTKAFELTLGARYATQSINALPTDSYRQHSHSNVVVDHESLLWHLNKKWQLYLKRDTNYRFAKANEKVWLPSNVHDLNTQRGTSYESGVQWQHDQKSFSLGVYQLNSDNEIAYDPTPTPSLPFGDVYNLPPTRRWGLDIWGNFPLSAQWIVGAQLTTVNAYFRSGHYQGKKVPAVPMFHGSVNITYQTGSHWLVNLNETYDSNSYASNDFLNQGPKMPSYFLTNIHIHKQWHRIGLNLEINNLFNKNYVRYADYLSGPNPVVEYYSAAGINFLVKLEVSLN